MPDEFPDITNGKEKFFEEDPWLIEFIWKQINEEIVEEEIVEEENILIEEQNNV